MVGINNTITATAAAVAVYLAALSVTACGTPGNAGAPRQGMTGTPVQEAPNGQSDAADDGDAGTDSHATTAADAGSGDENASDAGAGQDARETRGGGHEDGGEEPVSDDEPAQTDAGRKESEYRERVEGMAELNGIDWSQYDPEPDLDPGDLPMSERNFAQRFMLEGTSSGFSFIGDRGGIASPSIDYEERMELDDGRCCASDRIDVTMRKGSTVDDANALAKTVNGTVILASEGTCRYEIMLPEPASQSTLESLIRTMNGRDNVDNATMVYIPG